MKQWCYHVDVDMDDTMMLLMMMGMLAFQQEHLLDEIGRDITDHNNKFNTIALFRILRTPNSQIKHL